MEGGGRVGEKRKRLPANPRIFFFSPGVFFSFLPLSLPLPPNIRVAIAFTIVGEITKLNTLNKFMVSFDVERLSTNIPLTESIESAVEYIMKGNPNIKLRWENLT